MNRLRAVLDGGRPAVAVSVTNAGDVDADTLARHAAEAGVDVVELRIDRFPDPRAEAVLDYAGSFSDLPTVATIRSAAEGGAWRRSEAERLALFRSVLPAVDGVDVELSAGEVAREVVTGARALGTVAIVSYHNFDRVPGQPELQKTVDDAFGLGADYVKVSAMAHSLDDVRDLADFLLTNRARPLIVIAMGAVGTLSRVFFPALGSRLTYSFIGGSAAPGQLSFDETFAMLRGFYPDFDNQKITELGLLDGS